MSFDGFCNNLETKGFNDKCLSCENSMGAFSEKALTIF